MPIRNCEVKDVNEVYGLLNELEETIFDLEKFTSIYLEKLDDDNCYNLVYCVDNKVVGFIGLSIEYKLHHHDKVCLIEELVVNPNYRSQKIGSELLEKGISVAKYNNCELIELTSNIKRTRAHEFYKNHDFVSNGYRFIQKL